jgi:UPF0716 protein FxsA
VGILTLLFVVLPLVDLWLLLIIGDQLGFWPTVGLTIAVAVLGSYLGKREGLKVLSQWQRALGELRMPEDGLVSAALVLVGAVLLVTPGVLTDVLGLLCLFPPTRRLLAKGVSAYVARRLARAAERGTVTVRVVGFDSGSAGVGVQPSVHDSEGDVYDTEGVPLLEESARKAESKPS